MKSWALPVAQVLAGLLAILGGRETVIESPLITELVNEVARNAMQKAVLWTLEARFGHLPKDVASPVRTVQTEEQFRELLRQAVTAPDLGAFRACLPEPCCPGGEKNAGNGRRAGNGR
jgi:hypothetical protein